MFSPLLTCLALTAAAGSALMAGIFFTFSTFVTPALNRLPSSQAIAAMQRINEVVQHSAFMPVFFGVALASTALIVLGARLWTQPGAALLLGGAAAYLLGTFLVTVGVNVPLNDALAQAHANDDAAWSRYYAPWMLGNHLRTAAAMLGTAGMLSGLWQARI